MKISNFIVLVLLVLSAAVYSTDVSSCQVISSSGEYTLSADINGTPMWDVNLNGYTCIKIAASDVQLDCNGHTIQPDNGSLTSTISAISQSDLLIQNCKLPNSHIGIYASDLTSSTLIRNEFVNTTIAINLVDSNENRISKSTFDKTPIVLLRGAENKIDNNVITDASLKISNSQKNKIVSNSFTQNLPTLNSVIDLSGVSESNVEKNTVVSTVSSTNTGINLAQSDRNIIVNNDISSFKLCFAVAQSQLPRLVGNRASNCVTGFALLPGTKNSYVVDNVATNNAVHGFGFFSSPNDKYQVGNNTAINNQYGMFVSGSRDSDFEKNILMNSTASNFVISDSQRVTLNRNELIDGGNGLWIKNSKDIKVSGGKLQNKFLDMRVEGDSSYELNVNIGNTNPASIRLKDTLVSNEMYQIKSANLNLYLLPPDRFFFNKNFVNFEVLAGAPVVDELAFTWSSDKLSENDSVSTFDLFLHKGTWNSLNWNELNGTNNGSSVLVTNLTLENGQVGLLQQDQVAPFITMQSPTQDQDLSDTSVLFSFVAKDNFSNKLNCTLFVDGNDEVTYTANRGKLTALTYLDLQSGDHNWQVSCVDKFGNERKSGHVDFRVS